MISFRENSNGNNDISKVLIHIQDEREVPVVYFLSTSTTYYFQFNCFMFEPADTMGIDNAANLSSDFSISRLLLFCIYYFLICSPKQMKVIMEILCP